MESRLAKFIRRVQDTKADEIDCSECMDQVSEYVDLELDEGDAAASMPQVKQHLNQCNVCFEEYQMLRELASMEREGQTPDTEELVERLKKHKR